MQIKTWHSFHIVRTRPWPLLVSFHLLGIITRVSFFLNAKLQNKFMGIQLVLVSIILLWWKDTFRENLMTGNHTQLVSRGLKLGIIMFILSEVFFFLSFFWTFFHFFLAPNVELGQRWPPSYIRAINPIGTPLLNTLILLSSGVSITCSHNYLYTNMASKASWYLTLTWILGAYFLSLQYLEYYSAPFNITDSSYGRIFFMGTGFHGLHVIIGSLYLLYSNVILKKKWANKDNLISLDLRAWYWHFVDVVWIYLYLFMYWLPWV